MKILKKIWQNKILVLLLIALFFAVLLKVLSTPQPLVSPKELPTPTKYPLPASTPLIKPGLTPRPTPLPQTTINQIINQLPYQAEAFDIKYYPRDKSFAIVIRKGPLDQTMNEVRSWFQSQGIDNLSQLKISWEPTREVLNEVGVPPPIPEP